MEPISYLSRWPFFRYLSLFVVVAHARQTQNATYFLYRLPHRMCRKWIPTVSMNITFHNSIFFLPVHIRFSYAVRISTFLIPHEIRFELMVQLVFRFVCFYPQFETDFVIRWCTVHINKQIQVYVCELSAWLNRCLSSHFSSQMAHAEICCLIHRPCSMRYTVIWDTRHHCVNITNSQKRESSFVVCLADVIVCVCVAHNYTELDRNTWNGCWFVGLLFVVAQVTFYHESVLVVMLMICRYLDYAKRWVGVRFLTHLFATIVFLPHQKKKIKQNKNPFQLAILLFLWIWIYLRDFCVCFYIDSLLFCFVEISINHSALGMPFHWKQIVK